MKIEINNEELMQFVLDIFSEHERKLDLFRSRLTAYQKEEIVEVCKILIHDEHKIRAIRLYRVMLNAELKEAIDTLNIKPPI